MSNNPSKSSTSIGLGTVLFLIFLTLKLAGLGQVANWSWWWVTAPLWGPLALVLGFALIVIIIAVLIAGVALLLGKKVNLKEGIKMGFNNSIKHK